MRGPARPVEEEPGERRLHSFYSQQCKKLRLKKTDKLGDANIVSSFRSPCESMVGIYQLLKRVYENRSGHLKLPQAFLDRSS